VIPAQRSAHRPALRAGGVPQPSQCAVDRIAAQACWIRKTATIARWRRVKHYELGDGRIPECAADDFPACARSGGSVDSVANTTSSLRRLEQCCSELVGRCAALRTAFSVRQTTWRMTTCAMTTSSPSGADIISCNILKNSLKQVCLRAFASCSTAQHCESVRALITAGYGASPSRMRSPLQQIPNNDDERCLPHSPL